MLDESLAIVRQDMPLAPTAPGGMIEYRQALTTSFFFKFFVLVAKQIAPHTLSDTVLSAAAAYVRPLSKGLQHYSEASTLLVAGRDQKHLAGDLHTTGEAVYCDDIPAAGELFGALVMSSKAHARLVRVDAAKALALEGVHAYYGAADVPGYTGTWLNLATSVSRLGSPLPHLTPCHICTGTGLTPATSPPGLGRYNKWGPIFEDEEVFASDTVSPLYHIVSHNAPTILHSTRTWYPIVPQYPHRTTEDPSHQNSTS
jgi:hypothetical protein